MNYLFFPGFYRIHELGIHEIEAVLRLVDVTDIRVWEGMGGFGRVWDSMGRYGTVWDSVGGFGRVWDSMGRYGRVWAGMGVVWEDFWRFGSGLGVVRALRVRDYAPRVERMEIHT